MVDLPAAYPFDTSFIGTQWPESWGTKERVVLADMSFGAGSHFLSVWSRFEETGQKIEHLYYYAFEKNPLSKDDIKKEIGRSQCDKKLEKLLSLYPSRIEGWHNIRLSPSISLILIFGDIERELPEMQTPVDYWFLTGRCFSPHLVPTLKRLSHNKSYLSSYMQNPDEQNKLEEAGFRPIRTEKNSVTYIYNDGPRPQESNRKAKPEKIAIIGGGIAGAALAHQLSPYVLDITIFEKNGLASGGSGNDRGLCNPRISASKGPEADFYGPAFHLAHQIFGALSENEDLGFKSCGSLHLISDDNKEKRYHGFKDNWGWHDTHARIIDAKESSDIAGINLHYPCLYLPDAGMICPRKATQRLSQSANIIISKVQKLEECGSHWRIDGQYFDCVILAGSFDVIDFPYTHKLPIQKIRGQVTYVQTTERYNRLKTNLCYGGYASVAEDGKAILGSTFQTWIDDASLRPEDDIDNIDKLKLVVPSLAKDLTVSGGRASFRSAAKDRAPVIGQIHGVENLYISTAHGSHGLLSSIMGAEFLTSRILGDAHILPRSVERFLSPSRFKIH
ncbi:MAG: FAD-dependent 5-carboxymethylaminomethyl-2-thiouridine(34) oxidoreductase MnmC [Alphaproteobacteria bacterium]|nr:FAD-dependent 5-carboxymethylaminomethyl-2-thiouridine(34) oxidoreductase MnmC [Alphaproteobacteria bacterium]